MKTTDRVLSFLLALVMVFSLLPSNLAYAEAPEGSARLIAAPTSDGETESETPPSPSQEAEVHPRPLAGESNDAGGEPELTEGECTIAPVEEPSPTPAESEEPGDSDGPVGADAPGGPPVLVPESEEDEEDPKAGEIQALPPEDGAEPLRVSVSGVVYASELEENSDLVITEDTELRMDVVKVLRSITGDYALTINGSFQLTVNNPSGDAIHVNTLTSSVSMEISSSRGYGIYANDSVTVTGAVMLQVTADDDAVRAGKGINISAGTVSLNAGWDGLYAGFTDGSLSVSANTLTIEAGSNVIEQNKGAVTVNISGTGTLTSRYSGTGEYGYGITAAGDVNLGGSGMLTVISQKNCIIANGSVTDSNLSLDLTSSSWYGIYAEDDVAITGAVMLQVTADDDAVRAGKGINISAGTVSLNAGWDGLYAGFTDGSLSVSANTLTIDAGSNAIEQNKGAVTVNISGTGTLTSRYSGTGEYGYGITAAGDVNLGGGGMLTVSSQKNCIIANGSVTASNLSLDLTSSRSYGIYAEDDVAITGAAMLQVTADDDAVRAGKGINISAGTVNLNAGWDGLYAGYTDGSLSVSANTLTIEAGSNAIEQNKGAVTVNISGTGTLTSRYSGTGEYGYGITAAGDVNLGGGGMLTVSSQKNCIIANGSVTASNLSLDLTSSRWYGIYAEDDVAITGAVMLQVTADDDAVRAGKGINISAGTVSLNAGWDGLYAGFTDGSLSVSANTLTIDAGSNAIEQNEGAVTVNISGTGTLTSRYSDTGAYGYGITAAGDVNLGGGGMLTVSSQKNCMNANGSVTASNLSLDLTSSSWYGIYAEDDVAITGAALLQVTADNDAVRAGKGINISAGTVSLNAGWDGLYAGYTDGSLIVSANTLTIDAGGNAIEQKNGTATVNISGTGTIISTYGGTISDNGYGIVAVGDISLSGGTLTVRSTRDCVHSGSSVTMENGLLLYARSTGFLCAIHASEGIYLGNTLTVCIPKGSSFRNGDNMIMDAWGTYAYDVVIGTPLTGTLSIEGGATEYAYGETISVISSGLPSATEYMWQVSEDGENWTDLEPGHGVYSDSVIRIQRTPGISLSGQYYRLVATCTGLFGEVISPEVYVKRAYKVRYYPNGGSGSMDNVGGWLSAGSTFTLHQNTFTPPERKSFKAWRIDGVEYQPGDTITISGDTYIYAVWQQSEWLIQFSPGSGSGASGSMAPMTVPCGESFTFPPCSFTPPEGKTFSRWWLGGNLYYAPGDRITPNSNEVVVAEWRSNRTVVGFDPNGGRGSMNPVQLTPEQALAYTLPECTYNPPEDHVFEKWEVIDRNSGDSYFAQPGDVVALSGYNVTLKAVWTLKPYFEVSFSANGHGTAPLPQSVMQDHYAQDPGTLSAEGYTFLGWYTEAAGTNRFDFAATKITGPITLYAKWMNKITAIEISDFVFPEAGMRSVPSARITTGNRAYVCTGIEWRWPASNSSYGYAVSYTPMTFEPSTEYTAVITLETVRDYRFDTGEAPERVTINGETVNVDLTRSGYVSDTKYQLYTVPALTEDLIPIDAAHFPDDAFRAVLRGTRYDLNQDGYFSRSEIGVITELNLSQKNIASLEGIGCLSELKTLNAVDNALTTLDLSDNWMLETVYCSLNANLTELLLPKSAWLKWLQCYGCALTGLDLRGITYLSYAAATTPTISANGQQATYRYMVNGVKTAEMILDKSITLYDSYVHYARVRFDPGIGSGTMPSVMADKTEYYKLPANAFTAPEDMYFNGWKLGDTVYASSATMERLFAADENEVIFVAQWKSKAVLSVTVPIATRTQALGGFPVEFTFSGNLNLSGGSWLSSYDASTHTAGEIAKTLLANGTYYGMILFPKGVSAADIRRQMTAGTFVLKNADFVDLVSQGSGASSRVGMIVSVKPRTLTVTFMSGGGSGFMAPKTGLYYGSYTLPTCSFTAPADKVFDRWSLGAVGSAITLTEDVTLIARWKVADGAIPITEDYFPDDAFRVYVSENFDTNHGGYLTPAEINAVTEISMDSFEDLQSVQGIEYFTALTRLELTCNPNLTSVDFSANTQLTYLDLGDNKLESLDLTGLSHLTQLFVNGNKLNYLDVAGLPLTVLDCHANPLTALVLSEHPDLKRLYCHQTSIKVLDIRYCPYLLDAYENGTISDESTGTRYLGSLGGDLFVTVFDYTEILTPDCISVDPSHFPDPAFLSYVAQNFDTNLTQWLTPKEIQAAKVINCSGLSALESLQGIEYFTELETLNCSRCGLHGILDLSANWKLRSVNCGDNSGLDDLNLIGLTSLEELRCTNCGNLSDPDLSSNGALRLLHLANCQLSDLDLSQNPQLMDLDVSDNYFTSLDLSQNRELVSLICYSCEITALDLRANTKLEYLESDGMDSLQSLNVSGLTRLRHLDVSDCGLTTLDVSDCGLIVLECDHNPLETLILGEQPDLESLYCYAVELQELDLRGCPMLEDAWVNGTHTAYDWGLKVYNGDGLGGYMELDKDQAVRANGQTGDVNCDGRVTALDLIQMRKYLVGLETSASFSLTAADLTGDGNINILDLVRLRKILAP